MNSIHLIGNLTADAQCRVTHNNTTFTTFKLAVNRKYKDSESTTFASCILSGNTDKLRPYLTKGKKIAVIGRASCHAYLGSDNQPKAELDVYVSELELLGGKESKQELKSDDIPF